MKANLINRHREFNQLQSQNLVSYKIEVENITEAMPCRRMLVPRAGDGYEAVIISEGCT